MHYKVTIQLVNFSRWVYRINSGILQWIECDERDVSKAPAFALAAIEDKHQELSNGYDHKQLCPVLVCWYEQT